MIIFGTRRKPLKHVVAIEQKCDLCEGNEHLAVASASYFHVFWIPIFMYKKGVLFQCTHCKKTRHQAEFDRDIRPDQPEGMFAFKKVWGMYLGLLIIGFFAAFTMVSVAINSFL